MTTPGVATRVLVAGGGITARCAAAALKRHAPFLEVTLLATRPAPDALADRIACALPSLVGFHGDLSIGDQDAVARTGAGYRLGTRFAGWSRGLGDYAHVYGRYGQGFGPTSFHLHWLRAHRDGDVTPFDAYAPAAALARAGRFALPAAGTPFDGHEHGLTLELSRYATMLRAFGRHVGVAEIDGDIAAVRVEAGSIEQIALTDGRTLAADLYIDATGPEARLRGPLGGARDDWSAWLPCDRVLLRETADAEPLVLTDVVAHPAGWRWSAGTQAGIAYASAALDDGGAARLLGDGAGTPIRVSPGARREAWLGNVVAIGDAATEVEPLEWCNLHLALSAIDRLVAMLPAREPTPVEAADFNAQSLAEANRVRDFLAMHWRVAGRDEPLWRAIAAATPPATLAHTLAQWQERGRLPFYEEETFARDSWAAVLIGQGCLPRRLDPLVAAVPARNVAAAMSGWRAAIAAALPRAPTHAAFRAAQARRVTP